MFPPTDVHTATLVDDSIYIIGSLGCQGNRQFGTTPIYRLDTKTFRITKVDAGGEAPVDSENHRSFVLNVRRLAWYL